MKALARLQNLFGLPNLAAAVCWSFLALLYLPVALYSQLAHLSKPLIEPHLRQAQTALTTFYFARHEIPFLDYRSPLGGQLWNEVHELPIYQWICARLMNAGLSLEVASRGVGLFFFFAGLFLLALIVRHLFDKQTAAWTALLYAVSPLSMIYSRAGLIDYPCLFFVFLNFWSLLKALDPERRHFKRWLLVMLLSGSLAAAMKTTLWVFPAVSSFLYLAWLFWKRPEQRDGLVWMGTVLVAQGIFAVGWTIFANDIQRISGNYGGDFWIFGQLQDRLNPAIWRAAFLPLMRILLNDWMVLPVLAGIVLCRRNPVVLVSFALILLPFVVFLKVHSSGRDYYYLIEAPFIFLLGGMGLAALSRLKPSVRNGAFALLAALFLLKANNLFFVLSKVIGANPLPLRDGLTIKNLTDPKDIVVFDEVVGRTRYEIALYSERYLFFPSDRKEYSFEPSVFFFDEHRRNFFRLDPYPTIWIDAESSDFYVYRAKSEGKFLFDASRHVAVSAHRPTVGDQLVVPDSPSFPVSTCNATRPRIVELKKVPFEVWVKSIDSDRSLVFPGRNFLNLPTSSVFGCRFQITRVEKPAPVEN